MLLRCGGAALLLLITATQAQGQATITGRVTDAEGTPLGGAQVVIRELSSFGASTAENGAYTITVPGDQVKGQSVTLVARMLGRSPSVRAFTLNQGSQQVDFRLRLDPLRLDELVVTGVNEATSTKKLAFAVGRVSADQLQETPSTTALGGLQGKVAGVRVLAASGEPGSAPSIKMRGATSISGSSNPLIIIDGTISRATLADVSSEDIERVEVIKGAAASSLYGSDAANGVVQIFTKRGKMLADGKLLVTIRNEAGASFVSKRIPAMNSHAFKLAGGGFDRNAAGGLQLEDDRISDNAYPVFNDHQAELLRAGPFYTNYLSIGQRRGSTNFNASLQNTHTEGVIEGLDGLSRQNFRLNVDQQLTPRLDLEVSTFYGVSNNTPVFDPRAEQAGQLGPFFGITFVPPYVNLRDTNPDGSPFRAQIQDNITNATNPLYNLANEKRQLDRSRFSGGARMRWRMRDWLTAETNYNFEQEREDWSDLVPFGYLTSTGAAVDGSLTKRAFTGRTYNLGATLTALKRWGDITNTTKIAYVYEDQTSNQTGFIADKLIVKQVPEAPSADPSTFTGVSQSQTIRNRNAFAITTFDIKDRYIFDGLVRRDESSLFGPESRRSYYYRLSGAWRANEDLRISGFDEIRFRASYGTAGLRPGFEYQYETLLTAGGSFSKDRLGNRNLKPAHSAELEVGGNIEMGNGRFTLEYTYSRKETRDQIQLVDLPSVVGFTEQWQNVGSLKSSTHELALGYQIVNSRDLAWVLNVTADRTRQTITEYPLPERLNSFGQQPSVFFLAEGAKLGLMYGNRFVRSIEELYDDPAKAACRNTTCPESDFVVNELGYVVSKASFRCGEATSATYRDTGAPCSSPERFIQYITCKTTNPDGSCASTTNIVQIGDANPDFNMAFATSVNFRRLSLTGLVDWTQGGTIYNGTRQWKMINYSDPIFDQRGVDAPEQKSQDQIIQFYNGLNPHQFFAEPGTYVKLRELSLNYTLVRDQLRKVGLGRLENVRLGVVGRNLFTFTDYTGYDPEVSGLDGDPYQFRIDWFSYPHFRTFTGVVEIAF
jgi:TonB-linked SusC/RagA family outer membrane protein